MYRLLLAALPAACLGLLLAIPAETAAQQPPAAPPVSSDGELVERVRRAIDNGVKYLKNQQTPKGNWEGVVIGLLADMEGGTTALVTLALLNCGVRPDDPALIKPLDYLEKLPPKKVYVVGLQNLVFAETREKKYLPVIQQNADWLISHAIGYSNGAGRLDGWSYPGNAITDNSNTQYALLGLYAAKQAGAKIDDKVWSAILDYYTRTQVAASNTTGFWMYYNGKFGENKASISMSVAGVCGLLIAAMGLDESKQGLDPKTGIASNCGEYDANSALAKGMNWVGANFSFESVKSTFYNIYGIERLGRLSGQRFIGRNDWYREGCEKLVGRYDPVQKLWRGGLQEADGSFSAASKSIDAHSLLTTSFGLLFLSKGRTPVLISKLAWGDYQDQGGGTFREVGNAGDREGTVNWNRKHNDTRHIVEFCSRDLFKDAPLSWQVYDPRRLTFNNDEKVREEVGLLLQSPVLYINGHGRFGGNDGLSGRQKEILKLYLEEGGFVFAEACCGDTKFAESFRETMRELFEDKRTGQAGASFRRMPPEHAIWQMVPGITPADFPELEVLDRGCRTIAVFSPKPLAGYWEEAKYMPKDGRNPTNPGERAYCLARNVVAYATGMELPKPKLTRTNVVAKGTEVGVTRSHFKAAQLRLQGEQAPAPEALKNLMGFLRDNARLEVALNSAILDPGDDQILNFKFMYLHGRKPLNLDPAAIETIQTNLQTGGLLFADAACGNYSQWKDFDKSFREMCEKLYPGKKLEIIQEKMKDGREDPLFKLAREAGINLKNMRCRRELPNEKGPEPEMRPYPVLLEGIRVETDKDGNGGRWAVIYSKYDVGCAIEGHKAADCLGYDKDSALRIASAVVVYSLKR